MPKGKKEWSEQDTALYFMEQIVITMRRAAAAQARESEHEGQRITIPGAATEEPPPEITLPIPVWETLKPDVIKLASRVLVKVFIRHRYSDATNTVRIGFERM